MGKSHSHAKPSSYKVSEKSRGAAYTSAPRRDGTASSGGDGQWPYIKVGGDPRWYPNDRDKVFVNFQQGDGRRGHTDERRSHTNYRTGSPPTASGLSRQRHVVQEPRESNRQGIPGSTRASKVRFDPVPSYAPDRDSYGTRVYSGSRNPERSVLASQHSDEETEYTLPPHRDPLSACGPDVPLPGLRTIRSELDGPELATAFDTYESVGDMLRREPEEALKHLGNVLAEHGHSIVPTEGETRLTGTHSEDMRREDTNERAILRHMLVNARERETNDAKTIVKLEQTLSERDHEIEKLRKDLDDTEDELSDLEGELRVSRAETFAQTVADFAARQNNGDGASRHDYSQETKSPNVGFAGWPTSLEPSHGQFDQPNAHQDYSEVYGTRMPGPYPGSFAPSGTVSVGA